MELHLNLHVQNAREHLRYAQRTAQERDWEETVVAVRCCLSELDAAKTVGDISGSERRVIELIWKAAAAGLLQIERCCQGAPSGHVHR